MMTIKKVSESKLSTLIVLNGLPLVCTFTSANTYDFQLYSPTLETFEVLRTKERPVIFLAEVAHDA